MWKGRLTNTNDHANEPKNIVTERGRPASAGVQRQKRRPRSRRRVTVEPSRDEHDAALEELLLQPAPEAHAWQRTTYLMRQNPCASMPRATLNFERKFSSAT